MWHVRLNLTLTILPSSLYLASTSKVIHFNLLHANQTSKALLPDIHQSIHLARQAYHDGAPREPSCLRPRLMHTE